MSKTVIVFSPKGCEKAVNAEKLQAYFGCSHVVELDGQLRRQLHDGALHLTRRNQAELRRDGYRVDGVRMFSLDEALRFVPAAETVEA